MTISIKINEITSEQWWRIIMWTEVLFIILFIFPTPGDAKTLQLYDSMIYDSMTAWDILPPLNMRLSGIERYTYTYLPSNIPSDKSYEVPKAYPKAIDMIGHKELDCEKMAKDKQKQYGGSLVFLVGVQNNGAYILGDYAGHWVNKVYVKEIGRIQYIDYQRQIVYDDLEMMERDFRSAKGYAAVESFDMEEGRPPFNMKWHY